MSLICRTAKIGLDDVEYGSFLMPCAYSGLHQPDQHNGYA